MKLESRYSPKDIEERIYKNWEDKGYFKGTIDKSKKPFVIVMPPPNITGQLHMGHALDETIQDVLVRYHRMKQEPTLWLPGTDHASIATELKVVERLKKQGIDKKELGRENFLEEAWKWKEQYGGRITEQLRKLGSSCDWSRASFTMDENLNKAVEYVFVELYKKGLIYKGERIVNWCTDCKTSISDTEVEYSEEKSHLWHIKYMVEDSDEYIIVATTRPETILGDTAVAVNPDDERYKKLIGKELILPIVGRKIKVIADDYVEKDFGTGAVKITPAHDPNDYEVGLRHNLDVINVLDETGKVVSGYGKYTGMDRTEARVEIIKELQQIGALVKTEDYTHNVGRCYRCKTIVEPYASKQWFVKMKPLAEPAIKAVKKGETKFVPERFEKTYMNWMENIRDWCISRQLWWGHRIPAYYCDKCGEVIVSTEKPDKCKCGGIFNQDEDVLDTWFSSALWPFSTLGWPNKTEDFEYFYPTTTLVTGYDIITFWVSKMIFSAIEHTGKVPFKDVLVHGLVRDSQGRKMSKSLGNGIDPLEIIDKYGTDALRFSLVQNISPGNDIRFVEEKVEAGRNFANKLWNAARFSFSYIGDLKQDEDSLFETQKLLTEDKWILSKLGKVVKEVSENIERYEIGIALSKIYDFVWSDFCDTYIEMIKTRLYNKEGIYYTNTVKVLKYLVINILKLVHPYMPFITEEIYQNINGKESAIMISEFPVQEYIFEEEEKITEEIIDIIKQVRNAKAIANIGSSKDIKLYLLTNKYKNILEVSLDTINKLCKVETTNLVNNFEGVEGTKLHTVNIEAILDVSATIDLEEQRNKLFEEKARIIAELGRAKGMLANDSFVSKAPEKLITAEQEKVEKYTLLLEKIEESLK